MENKKIKTSLRENLVSSQSSEIDPKNLNDNLKRLAEITAWFDDREEVNVEEGLEKVKEAVSLIKFSKERLKKIENEFSEIKKEIETEDEPELED